MTTFGPTSVIDRCESFHRLLPEKTWDDDSTLASSFRGSVRNSVGWSLDSEDETTDNESIGSKKSSSTSLTQINEGGGQRMSVMIPPSGVTGVPLQHWQQQPSSQTSHGYSSYQSSAATAATAALLQKARSYTTNSRTTGGNKRKQQHSIRFQVVVWDVGPVDVALGRVPMTFRVSMFWEDIQKDSDSTEQQDEVAKATHTEWTMAGRRKAYEHLVRDETVVKTVDVPPVSLLNVVTFDVIGQPEVCVLREQERDRKGKHQKRRLMRWTCLYKATLLQDNMKLDHYPHDKHILALRLGILANRRPGSRWGIDKYKLELATEDDSQHSTRLPHGVIVDHARVPGFTYNREEGLQFEFVPHNFGTNAIPVGTINGKALHIRTQEQDTCLEVRLRVQRESGYYDNNIMPLICLLNTVAVSIPLSLESTYFFQRGLMLLNITFVQIGIRMNSDKNLPSVGYQIKMQRIMNHFFFSLLALVLESSLVYILHDQLDWSLEATQRIDQIAAGIAFCHIVVTSVFYYLLL